MAGEGPDAGLVPYQVTVVTSDVRGAGTDADVMLTMVGDKGSAGPFKLDDSKNNFERGQTDTFTVQAREVGALQHIQISCKGGGLGAAWHLAHVTITHPLTQSVTRFDYNNWFDKRQGLTQVRGPGRGGSKRVAGPMSSLVCPVPKHATTTRVTHTSTYTAGCTECTAHSAH